MFAPIFVRCTRCAESFSYYQKKGHVCPERKDA